MVCGLSLGDQLTPQLASVNLWCSFLIISPSSSCFLLKSDAPFWLSHADVSCALPFFPPSQPSFTRSAVLSQLIPASSTTTGVWTPRRDFFSAALPNGLRPSKDHPIESKPQKFFCGVTITFSFAINKDFVLWFVLIEISVDLFCC